MGLFSSNKSSTSSNVNTYNIANYGAEGSGGPVTLAGVSAGNDLTLNLSDYGAISGALSLASGAMSTAIDAVSSNANSIVAKTLDIASKNQVSESAQMQDTLLKLGLIGAIAFVLYAWKK